MTHYQPREAHLSAATLPCTRRNVRYLPVVQVESDSYVHIASKPESPSHAALNLPASCTCGDAALNPRRIRFDVSALVDILMRAHSVCLINRNQIHGHRDYFRLHLSTQNTFGARMNPRLPSADTRDADADKMPNSLCSIALIRNRVDSEKKVVGPVDFTPIVYTTSSWPAKAVDNAFLSRTFPRATFNSIHTDIAWITPHECSHLMSPRYGLLNNQPADRTFSSQH